MGDAGIRGCWLAMGQKGMLAKWSHQSTTVMASGGCANLLLLGGRPQQTSGFSGK
jgi:hypothetical protein